MCIYGRAEELQSLNSSCKSLKAEIDELMLRQSMQSLNNTIIRGLAPTPQNTIYRDSPCKCTTIEKPTHRVTNCKNCGAPIKGHICEYCGTQI